MVSGTSCTVTVTTGGYNGTPICIATTQEAAPMYAACAWDQGSLTATVTASGSNSLTWGVVLIGNPN
jgi:hypothetical protein